MTEDHYDPGEFTDGELNCQADLADYRGAVEEIYLEYRDQMAEETREKFRRYLEESHHGNILVTQSNSLPSMKKAR
jgi:hypothetical protein